MIVCVSGASGLIGSALSRALEAEGHRVLRLRRGGITQGDDIGWDPEAGRIDAPALEGIDAVVHLAGEGIGERRWTPEQKRRILESRTRSTALLAGALATRERKPAVFVSASAIGYYGDRGDEVLTEQSPCGDDFLSGVCVEWEAAASPAAECGIRTVIVRTGIVLSAEGGVLTRMLLPFRLGLGGRIGSGRQWMSWIAIDDEVGAILHAIGDEEVSGPVNLTAPSPVTNSTFTRALGSALRRPTFLPTPLAPLRVRYGRELVRSLLLVSQRVTPARLEASGYAFRYTTLDDALHAMIGRSAR